MQFLLGCLKKVSRRTFQKGTSLVRGARKCNDPEAGVWLEYSRIVWLGQSKAKSGS